MIMARRTKGPVNVGMQQGHTRVINYPVGRILPEMLNTADHEEDVYGSFHGYKVKLTSKRYDVFKVSNKCYKCGLEGTSMGLDTSGGKKKNAHFNLYGIDADDKEVLLTKGTAHDPEGYKTTCKKCARVISNFYNMQNRSKDIAKAKQEKLAKEAEANG